ncbi:SusC/RagA family TonB-linked outer membrane protein [Draconibacterium sediminis]|uniref:Collagen-binding protein n=1 Tax=Draconibacterium sediminis TaxID=1544798 RepID=A0A0D8JG84_9BACT|nr:TonB-dependent receptor [Draconibacterium sediminis]KJF45611.1 collagen-binding protein [Draconibacterium sediminis]
MKKKSKLNQCYFSNGILKTMALALMLIIVHGTAAFAGSGTALQEKSVTGTVFSTSGESLPGVSILVKGTTRGTISDVDGNFSLKDVRSEDILVFSFIGMKEVEVTVGDQTSFEVTMEDAVIGVDEVVVVGYGTQKKSDVTGSVSSVSEERLAKIPVSNVMQAVQGAVSGVNISQASSIPGESPSIVVRGGGSLTASTSPYVVVDGIPISKMDGSINDINPNDIKSIEILKDASATAIYGMNGANGVILITTKRGKSSAPKIRYSGYYGVEEFAHIPEMVSPEELLNRYAEGNRINGSPLYDAPVKYEYEVENYANGHIIDWIDAVSQTGIQQNHNVSISGGTENLNYYISGDILDQKGVVKGYNYKRYSLRTNIDAQVTNYLKIGTNSSIVHHNRDGGRANLLNAEAMSPYGRMYEEDGSYTIYPMYGETLWANPLLPTTTNPERRQYNMNLNGYAFVTFGDIWKPLTGLTYRLNAGFSYIPRRTSSYNGKSVNDQLGTAEIYHAETQAYTIENILRYDRDIDKHHFDITAVYGAQERNYNNNWAQARDFVNDELYWNRMQAGASSNVSSYADRYASVSQMGRLNYVYDSRYLFTFTVRRDGSSVFSDGVKYGTFPSIALGWNMRQENFMANAENITNLKLRLSYGKSGNEAVGVYNTFTTMTDRQIALGGITNIAMVTDRLGNSDLSWETKESLNAGLDFGFFNNRINGSLDVYTAKNTDLLLARKLPIASGFSQVTSNIGETSSKGIELTLNTVNVNSGDFKWNSAVVFSTNKTEIVALYGDGQDDLGSGWFIGEPIGVIRDYTNVGIWQEDEIANGDHLNWDPVAKPGDVKLADISGPDGVPDGVINDDDRSILGQRAPKWTGGLTNTFSYKNFTFNVFIQTTQGAMRGNAHLSMASDEIERRNSFAEIGYWTPENQSNEWRSLNKNSNPHGYGFPVKNNFTRIKDITLNYDFPSQLTNKIGVDALSMYLSGRNLYTFTDWIGWDPEERSIGRGSNNWDINYPSVRTIVFGINLTL